MMHITLNKLLYYLLTGEQWEPIKGIAPFDREARGKYLTAKALITLLTEEGKGVGVVQQRLSELERLLPPRRQTGKMLFHRDLSEDYRPGIAKEARTRSIEPLIRGLRESRGPTSENRRLSTRPSRQKVVLSSQTALGHLKVRPIEITLKGLPVTQGDARKLELRLNASEHWLHEHAQVLVWRGEHDVQRATFDLSGMAELRWPDVGEHTLRVDVGRYFAVATLEIGS